MVVPTEPGWGRRVLVRSRCAVAAEGIAGHGVQNPLTSLRQSVEGTQRILAQQGSTVLVAHCFGGMILTEAGVDPKVSRVTRVAIATNPDVLGAFMLVIVAGEGPPAYPDVVGHEPNCQCPQRSRSNLIAPCESSRCLRLRQAPTLRKATTSSRIGKGHTGGQTTHACLRSNKNTTRSVCSSSGTASAQNPER